MKKSLFVLSLLILAGLLMAACSPAAGTPAAATATLPAEQVVAPSPTTAPTATPQPGKVLLVAPAGTASPAAQAMLAELSAPAGLLLENRPELKREELGPEVKVVVFLSPPANLAELAGAAPAVQFVVASPVDQPSAGNLTVIRQRIEYHVFLAGFISALLSPDYRTGGLLPADGPLGASLQDAFVNGARYYCGVCAPGYPLNVYYPQIAALPAASDGPTWQASLAGLSDNQLVEVVYVSPEAARPEVYGYLNGKTQLERPVLLVGAQTPPEELRQQWAATVTFNTLSVLRQVWPDILSGKGGQVVEAPLLLEDVNPDLLGGRQRLVDELLVELQAGMIFPFTISEQ